MSAGSLDGIRVLEFANYVSGPFAGMLLSDLGAEVIKVEAPEGDDTRHAEGPPLEGLVGLRGRRLHRRLAPLAGLLRLTAGSLLEGLAVGRLPLPLPVGLVELAVLGPLAEGAAGRRRNVRAARTPWRCGHGAMVTQSGPRRYHATPRGAGQTERGRDSPCGVPPSLSAPRPPAAPCRASRSPVLLTRMNL